MYLILLLYLKLAIILWIFCFFYIIIFILVTNIFSVKKKRYFIMYYLQFVQFIQIYFKLTMIVMWPLIHFKMLIKIILKKFANLINFGDFLYNILELI